MGAASGPAAASSVDEVLGLYEEFGPHHYDEVVSQLDHALQCAALARAEDASDALVAAALLHDVGHLLHLRSGGTGPAAEDLDHESVGARYLGGLFPPVVTRPVALHVQAKRYLCAVDPDVPARLSEGSRASLVRQGGPLDDAGVRSFEAEAGHEDAVRLRRWDDAGKVEGLDVAPLHSYAPLLARLAG
jgi:[1-hydroxy-2-(trimethylamino)ethyl]phosphonate dioxygenase